MGGDMGGNACKISVRKSCLHPLSDFSLTFLLQMLWNWYTVDACFLARSWHVTSSGMFAGSCIGVIGLVIALEFLRRLGKEYDHFLLRDFQSRPAAVISTTPYVTGAGSTDAGDGNSSEGLNLIGARMAFNGPSRSFRPNLLQQAIRALLHMLQFAVAYFIMLLAMYYNGYIIICIFIGAYIGYFIFGWETVSLE